MMLFGRAAQLNADELQKLERRRNAPQPPTTKRNGCKESRQPEPKRLRCEDEAINATRHLHELVANRSDVVLASPFTLYQWCTGALVKSGPRTNRMISLALVWGSGSTSFRSSVRHLKSPRKEQRQQLWRSERERVAGAVISAGGAVAFLPLDSGCSDPQSAWGALLGLLVARGGLKLVFNASMVLKALLARVGCTSVNARALFEPGSELFDAQIAASLLGGPLALPPAIRGGGDGELPWVALCRAFGVRARRGAACGRNIIDASSEHSEHRCCDVLDEVLADVSSQLALAHTLLPMLADAGVMGNGGGVLARIEMPIATVLARLELDGCAFDEMALNTAAKRASSIVRAARLAAQRSVGDPNFNIASNQQVAAVLGAAVKEVVMSTKREPDKELDADSSQICCDRRNLLLLAEVWRKQGRLPSYTPRHGEAFLDPELVVSFRSIAKWQATWVGPRGLAVHARRDAAEAGSERLVDCEGARVRTVRIHARWHQTSTQTGRISSSQPSLQALPLGPVEVAMTLPSDLFSPEKGENESEKSPSSTARVVFACVVRDAIVPSSPLKLLISADYCQMELRILAVLCQRYFGHSRLFALFVADGGSNGNEDLSAPRSSARKTCQSIKCDATKNSPVNDPYVCLASEIYGVPGSSVTPTQRKVAKTALLAVTFGMGVAELATRLGVRHAAAVRIRSKLLTRFPEIKRYRIEAIRRARDVGYALTIGGRRRTIVGLHDTNSSRRAAAERQAVNTPVQGSGGEIIKIAMIRVALSHRLRLLLQVHDELLVECDERDATAAIAELRNLMTNAVRLNGMPFPVRVTSGKTWAQCSALA